MNGRLQINGEETRFYASFKGLSKGAFLALCKVLSIADPHIRNRKLLKWGIADFDLVKKQDAETKLTLLKDKKVLGWIEEAPQEAFYKLRYFWYKGRLYVGPPKDLSKLTITELLYASFYYSRIETQDWIADAMIDCLYRPISIGRWLKRWFSDNPNLDLRKPLNDHLHEKRYKRLRGLPFKTAIVLQFGWAMARFSKRFPRIYRKGDGKGMNPNDLVALVLEVSGEKFGDYQKTIQTEATLVFNYVELQMKKNQLDEAHIS